MKKLKHFQPHKPPPIIRWLSAFGGWDYSLEDQIKYELYSTNGKSAEALRKIEGECWVSDVARSSTSKIGLIVDISKTPLHRCYTKDVTTGLYTKKNIPVLRDYQQDIEYISKYKQIWGSRHKVSAFNILEAVVGNGRTSIKYKGVVYLNKKPNIPSLPMIQMSVKNNQYYIHLSDYNTNSY